VEYEGWEKTVPQAIREDSLWKMKAYRLALFLADVGWGDVTLLAVLILKRDIHEEQERTERAFMNTAWVLPERVVAGTTRAAMSWGMRSSRNA
jgi:hypothetical protein